MAYLTPYFGNHSYCRTNRAPDYLKHLLREAEEEPSQREERNPVKEGLCCNVRGQVRREEEMQNHGLLNGWLHLILTFKWREKIDFISKIKAWHPMTSCSITSSQRLTTHYWCLAHSISFHVWSSQIFLLWNGQASLLPISFVFPILPGETPLLSHLTFLLSAEQDPLLLSCPRLSSPPGLYRPHTFLSGHPVDQPLSFLPLSSILLTYAYILLPLKIFFWFWSLSSTVSPESLTTKLKG